MADEILGTAQIEIVASLDELSADLDQALAMVTGAGLEFESVWSQAGDQMLEGASAARDSWLSLGDAAQSLTADIEKLIVQLTIVDPLLDTLSGGDSGLPGAGGGLLSGAPGLLGLGLGGGSEADVAGGIESQLLSSPAVASSTVSVNVHNYSGSPATTRQSQGGKGIDVVIGEMNARDVRSNGPLGQAIRQQYGASTMPIQR